MLLAHGFGYTAAEQMAALIPELDQNALRYLRDTVKALHRRRHTSVPIPELIELAAMAPAAAGVTIDFEASRELGHELIVVRMPTPYDAGVTDPRLATLSRREREVASLIAAGLSNKDIAARLSIASSTVKDHVHHILRKTGMSNRAAVAAVSRAPAFT